MNPPHSSNWTSPKGMRGFEETELRTLPAIDRYRYVLEHLPPSGVRCCQQALLRVANFGRAASVSREQIGADLARHVHGERRVKPKEIEEAIDKAFNTKPPERLTPRVNVDGERLLNAILFRGMGFTEAELLDASPIRIDWEVKRDGIEVLQRLYSPEERLFIGSKYDAGAQHIRTISEWVRQFEHGFIPEHIIPNPLTGEIGLTKECKPSY